VIFFYKAARRHVTWAGSNWTIIQGREPNGFRPSIFWASWKRKEIGPKVLGLWNVGSAMSSPWAIDSVAGWAAKIAGCFSQNSYASFGRSIPSALRYVHQLKLTDRMRVGRRRDALMLSGLAWGPTQKAGALRGRAELAQHYWLTRV